MTRARCRALQFCWFAVAGLFASAASSAAPPRPTQDVQFYATGFLELLTSLRALVDTSSYCHQGKNACGTSLDAHTAALADMGQVLGGLTTFPMTSTMPDPARQQEFKSPESAKAMFAALRTEYESKLRIFDIQLMAHYGAVLDECDPWTSAAVKRSNELNVIMAIDLGAYWNLEGDKEVDALVDIRFEVADSLEGTSKERCASLMALGRKLLVVLGNRVRPYATSDTTPSEADRFNMSIAFSRSIALELEAAMRPAILQEDDTGKAQLKPQ